jgi:hypothetical protein
MSEESLCAIHHIFRFFTAALTAGAAPPMHIAGPGAVGVWTKADSVTSFDDFSYGKS